MASLLSNFTSNFLHKHKNLNKFKDYLNKFKDYYFHNIAVFFRNTLENFILKK